VDRATSVMSETVFLAGKSAAPRSWLLRISHEPWNYPLSFVFDSGMALVPLAWCAFRLPRPGPAAAVAVSALLGYTLYEYLMHRFVFHGSYAPDLMREGHSTHHRMPEARLAQPFFASGLHGAAVLIVVMPILGPVLGSLFLGVSGLGYLAYGTVHHLTHAGGDRSRLVRWLHDVHEVHHLQPGRNFGVTTPLWDVVFGTWSSPRALVKPRSGRPTPCSGAI
jgi:sterol desaturase/sphingolipid hydroxylase (fatty acid hydroxylase superfamily)